MPKKPSLYIESTIPSYLVSPTSRDIIVLGHQQLTRDWWDNQRHNYDLCISQVVIDEIKRGDLKLADKRMEIIRDNPMLKMNDKVESLAEKYFKNLKFPPKALRDAFHLAFTVIYK